MTRCDNDHLFIYFLEATINFMPEERTRENDAMLHSEMNKQKLRRWQLLNPILYL